MKKLPYFQWWSNKPSREIHGSQLRPARIIGWSNAAANVTTSHMFHAKSDCCSGWEVCGIVIGLNRQVRTEIHPWRASEVPTVARNVKIAVLGVKLARTSFALNHRWYNFLKVTFVFLALFHCHCLPDCLGSCNQFSLWCRLHFPPDKFMPQILDWFISRDSEEKSTSWLFPRSISVPALSCALDCYPGLNDGIWAG